jgi:hypothetical protein
VATLVQTGTVTINAAFLQELKDVNHELWQTLAECRRFCEQPHAVHRLCHDFVQQLGELCDQLAMHFALEEAYGYFDDPISVAPYLAERCGALRAEHAELYLEFSSLVESAEQLFYDRKLMTLVAQVPRAFHHFDHRLMDHEAQEMELVQEAFDSDIGTGD